MNSGALRIVDANANRAREALRTMEDLARFLLNDPHLSEDLKRARHDLREVLDASGMSAATVLAHRDTPGDVGTAITSATEQSRTTSREVAIAAGKRAGEALRVLEETLKWAATDRNADGRAKALRYRVYELERRLVLAFGAGRGGQWRLCVLITASLCRHHEWLDVARLAIDGGADCLQLREKELDGTELLHRARRLVALCRDHGVAAVINDRPDIAILAAAHGVHLGQTDLPVTEARKICGEDLLIGVSTSNLDQARQAAQDGADVCGVGPMFATTTKHKPVLSGPAYLRSYLEHPQTARIPHLAIGGITAANAAELVSVGARGVAVSGAVCGAPDPAAACREILGALVGPQGQPVPE